VGRADLGAEQLLQVELAPTHQVIVGDDDAVQRREHGAQGVDEGGDADAADEGYPQCADEEGDTGGDETTSAGADMRRRQVRQVIGWRDEVGHQVDAHGRGEEGQRGDDGQGQVVDACDDVGRVGQRLNTTTVPAVITSAISE